MPFVPIPIREAKEPVNSGWPHLKSLIKEKGRKQKPRAQKAERRRKSQSAKRRYAKRRAVKALRVTWFLVIWVPNIIKILPKRHSKLKEGLLVKTPA